MAIRRVDSRTAVRGASGPVASQAASVLPGRRASGLCVPATASDLSLVLGFGELACPVLRFDLVVGTFGLVKGHGWVSL